MKEIKVDEKLIDILRIVGEKRENLYEDEDRCSCMNEKAEKLLSVFFIDLEDALWEMKRDENVSINFFEWYEKLISVDKLNEISKSVFLNKFGFRIAKTVGFRHPDVLTFIKKLNKEYDLGFVINSLELLYFEYSGKFDESVYWELRDVLVSVLDLNVISLLDETIISRLKYSSDKLNYKDKMNKFNKGE